MNNDFHSESAELEGMDLDANILTHLLCYKCERHFEQFSESKIEDVHHWSRDVSIRAMQAGRHFVDCEILCPDCLPNDTVA